jgi:hypothetical protein
MLSVAHSIFSFFMLSTEKCLSTISGFNLKENSCLLFINPMTNQLRKPDMVRSVYKSKCSNYYESVIYIFTRMFIRTMKD